MLSSFLYSIRLYKFSKHILSVFVIWGVQLHANASTHTLRFIAHLTERIDIKAFEKYSLNM